MVDYISREAAIDAIEGINWYKYNDEGRLVQGGTSHDKMFLPYKAVEGSLKAIPAADVRPVVTCADCEHNNHCLTQEFVDDCGKIPLDRNTFFCADGERRSNA